ncbi:MAG: serine O-acetyltransferase [Planctomycetales bacterium]
MSSSTVPDVPPATPKPPRSLFGLVASDLRAKAQWCYHRTDGKGLVKALLTDGTAAMLWYRLMQWAGRYRLLSPLAMLFNKFNAAFCQCIIGRGAEFGPGFVLIHSQGVVINGEVRGGSRVYLEHQVTIGADRSRSPVLGSDVYVGAGAKLIGPITIGDDVRVGANAVVVKDVPSGATVVGIPAQIVRQRRQGESGASGGQRELPVG